MCGEVGKCITALHIGAGGGGEGQVVVELSGGGRSRRGEGLLGDRNCWWTSVLIFVQIKVDKGSIYIHRLMTIAYQGNIHLDLKLVSVKLSAFARAFPTFNFGFCQSSVRLMFKLINHLLESLSSYLSSS